MEQEKEKRVVSTTELLANAPPLRPGTLWKTDRHVSGRAPVVSNLMDLIIGSQTENPVAWVVDRMGCS